MRLRRNPDVELALSTTLRMFVAAFCLLAWLPPSVDRARLAALDTHGLRCAIIDQNMELCFRDATSVTFRHEDVHVAAWLRQDVWL